MLQLYDAAFWHQPIRWTQHKGKHVACGDCLVERHTGMTSQPPKAALRKRSSGVKKTKRDLWLCSEHAQEWRDEQHARKVAAA